jgi:outer membrane protein assembly factor BamD
MNLPIPTPTPEQIATSTALENSRGQYRLQDRARLMILRRPDVVMAAHSGEPPLTDAKPTLAPAVTKQILEDYKNAMNPNSANAATAATPTTAQPAADAGAAPAETTAATPAASKAPLALQDIPAADAGTGSTGAVMTNVPGATGATASPAGGANSMGVEVLTPGANGNATQQPAADANGGLKAVGPTNSAVAPPIEKPAAAPEQVNAVAPGEAAPGQPNAVANGKKTPKPAYDKDEESSSKHKKKKGLAKINPF